MMIMKNLRLFLLPMAAMLFLATKCDDDESTIPLPPAIQNYLNTNYPGAEIEASEMDTLCTGAAVYEVELEISDDNEIELAFDTESNLLFTETDIASDGWPAGVAVSVSANYAGYAIAEAAKLELSSGGNQYEVELKKGASQLEVLFAADGTKICEEAGDDDDDE